MSAQAFQGQFGQGLIKNAIELGITSVRLVNGGVGLASQMLTPVERKDLSLRVSTVFSPAAPIDDEALFAGRIEQANQVVDAINQRGQHVIIFGERGVGKTSLARTLASRLNTSAGGKLLAPHVNCDSADTFTSLWKKVFSEFVLTKQRRDAGFQGSLFTDLELATDNLPNVLTSSDVRKALALASPQPILLIVDEFDRIRNHETRAMFADTIKLLSDHGDPATLLIIGVADAVTDLIKEHESVERALVQVPMPRMQEAELEEIIKKGLGRLGMAVQVEAMMEISKISRGLPHYAHLLGLHAAREAIGRGLRRVDLTHVKAAVVVALKQAQQSTQDAYHLATLSQKPDALRVDALLACSLARTDSMGWFQPVEVREPLCRIRKKSYSIADYTKHLNEFCTEERGRILESTGSKNKVRYRFRSPMMQPYVTMQGLVFGRLPWINTASANPDTPSPNTEPV